MSYFIQAHWCLCGKSKHYKANVKAPCCLKSKKKPLIPRTGRGPTIDASRFRYDSRYALRELTCPHCKYRPDRYADQPLQAYQAHIRRRHPESRPIIIRELPDGIDLDMAVV